VPAVPAGVPAVPGLPPLLEAPQPKRASAIPTYALVNFMVIFASGLEKESDFLA
jgi:hypothetical protein